VTQMEKRPSPANTEDSEKKDITKTTEYHRFHKLLNQVFKAPPMKKKSA